MAGERSAKGSEADRAVAAVGRAVARLGLALVDADERLVPGAVEALAAIGPYAIGPLGAAVRRPGPTRRRGAIVGMIILLGGRDRDGALAALTRALERERDDHVRSLAAAGVSSLLAAGIAERAARAGGPADARAPMGPSGAAEVEAPPPAPAGPRASAGPSPQASRGEARPDASARRSPDWHPGTDEV